MEEEVLVAVEVGSAVLSRPHYSTKLFLLCLWCGYWHLKLSFRIKNKCKNNITIFVLMEALQNIS